MRAIFSVLGLLAVLLMVGVLVKKQLGTSPPPAVWLQQPGQADPALTPAATPPGTSPQAQSQQLQQQVRQSLESALQQARPLPDEQ
jgi:hypothetical protein